MGEFMNEVFRKTAQQAMDEDHYKYSSLAEQPEAALILQHGVFHALELLRAECWRLDRECARALKHSRNQDLTIGYLQNDLTKAREEYHQASCKAYELEQLLRDQGHRDRCQGCRQPLTRDWKAGWQYGDLLCCSERCFRRTCWQFFNYYITVQKELKTWRDAGAKLRRVRRWLHDQRKLDHERKRPTKRSVTHGETSTSTERPPEPADQARQAAAESRGR